MSKFPRLGEVKTRLIPELGAEAALELHQQMSQHIVAQVKELAASRNDVSYAVHVAHGGADETRAWLGCERVEIQPCGEGIDLGAKMKHGVERSLAGGAQRVIVVGTDCPFLSPEIIAEAMEETERNDVVYIPAHDGGFVLLGLSAAHDAVFENIHWGSESVLEESIAHLNAAGLSHILLEPLPDVDQPADVAAALAVMQS